MRWYMGRTDVQMTYTETHLTFDLHCIKVGNDGDWGVPTYHGNLRWTRIGNLPDSYVISTWAL